MCTILIRYENTYIAYVQLKSVNFKFFENLHYRTTAASKHEKEARINIPLLAVRLAD